METETMGRVLVTAKIENLADLYIRRRGLLLADGSTDEVNDARWIRESHALDVTRMIRS